MNTRNEWQKILRLANEELKPTGYEIRIVEYGFGSYNCEVVETYAENYYESELTELVTDALHYTKNKANL